jgi:hypothetical protein
MLWPLKQAKIGLAYQKLLLESDPNKDSQKLILENLYLILSEYLNQIFLDSLFMDATKIRLIVVNITSFYYLLHSSLTF